YVDLELVVQNCAEGKQGLAGLKLFVDAKTLEFEKAKKELDALNAKLDAQREKLTDDARAELEDEVAAKTTSLARLREDAQKEAEKRRGRLVNRVTTRLRPILEKLAKDRGLNAVLYHSRLDVWIDPSADLTSDTVKAYDLTYPAKMPQTR